MSELVGAAHGERAPEERLTHRNGYRARSWATRAGELELAIPKLRRGSYFPSFLEPRRRSEQALVSVVQEAYVVGAGDTLWQLAAERFAGDPREGVWRIRERNDLGAGPLRPGTVLYLPARAGGA